MQFEFPVGPHRFSTDEFNRKKAEYTAKHGYTMHIPGFSDIFKIGLDYKPTEREVELYRKKDIDALGFDKYDQIARIMKKKKESFLRMMSSPNPTWLNNIGTTMTFLDDINDAAGTLSVVARTAAHLLPKAFARYFMGPAGWALTIADAVNVAMVIARSPLDRLSRKNTLHKGYSMNPFCKQARVQRSLRLKKIKPSKGELIELFQTTNSMFGIGLSLGPLVGAFLESFTGPIRVLQGKKVTVKWPVPDFSYFERVAMTSITAADALSFGDDELSEEDHTKIYLVAEMATHVLQPIFEQYHPLDKIDGLENIILTPPKVTDPLTKLLFAKEGIDPDAYIGHPGTEDTDGSVNELMDTSAAGRQTGLRNYAYRGKDKLMGILGMMAANNFTENSLALYEGSDQVELAFEPALEACFRIIERGYFFHRDTTYQQRKCFVRLVSYPLPRGHSPSFELLRSSICPRCGIRLSLAPGLATSRALQEILGPTDWQTYLDTGKVGAD